MSDQEAGSHEMPGNPWPQHREPIQDDQPKKFEWLTNTDYIKQLEAERDRLVAERDHQADDIAAWKFNMREWRDKAQDKIRECEELVAERDRLLEALQKVADHPSMAREIAEEALTTEEQEGRR